MKLNRTSVFITISSIALLLVLIIQVNWIFQTAKIKEEFFNEKANMVLSKTTEAIKSDEETYRKIEACVDTNTTSVPAAKLGKSEVAKIDSIFNYYMNFYNFHIDYTFEVLNPNPAANYGNGFSSSYYNKTLEEVAGNSGVALKLILPEKKQFIIAEMGTLFITSVFLIVVVLILFWRTILSLHNEKKYRNIPPTF
ncbi:MAG: hypothetical protein IPP71_03715 [Bacteroidetes bacterium]|nr:hypothetical protein [Bacteroidota bacterium]